jgi:hypothetical protein
MNYHSKLIDFSFPAKLIGIGTIASLTLSGCVTMPSTGSYTHPAYPPGPPGYSAPPPLPPSPQGDIIRSDGAQTIAWDWLPEIISGRPVSVDIGKKLIQSYLYYQSIQIAASRADEEHARKMARTYRVRTDARYLAVRTPSSRSNSTPDVTVVDRKTGQVKSSYRLKENPTAGQKIQLQNDWMCEYVP